MFTGLIETTGTVLSVTQTTGALRLIIAAPKLAGRWHMGDSIAVNGVCLTALDVEETDEEHPGRFAADLATETVERTTLSNLQPGALVNLELPTPAGSPLGGHVVQGHVDATARLVSLIALHPLQDYTDWRMTIEVPPSLGAYIVSQGSITVDGISLTVARVNGSLVEIAVIPHTYKSTHLHSLLAGSLVNIEVDVLSKYAARRAELEPLPSSLPWQTPVPAVAAPVAHPQTTDTLTIDYLLANGY